MFRIGTTSYILPDEILPNVAHLAPLVDDVELVLFETDEHGSNLPDAGQTARLVSLAGQHNLTYTVHLPLDLRLADEGAAQHVSLVKARRVIEATRALAPWGYVVHLDGRVLMADASAPTLARWQENARGALTLAGGWLAGPDQLCVENVEKWDPEAFAPVVAATGVSRTMDIGHLWLAGVDPLPYIQRWCARARIVHLHGIGDRDHQSLALVAPRELDRVVAYLAGCFRGVVTLEVFNPDDFHASLAALQASLGRLGLTWSKSRG